MLDNIKKYFVMMSGIFLALPAFAQDNVGLEYGEQLGLGNTDPITITVNLVKLALGFLALLFVIILLLGGLKWMTAMGNDEKADEAKKTITNGIVGVIIILLAWSIVSWILQTVTGLTTE